jgi:hypothetical protein
VFVRSPLLEQLEQHRAEKTGQCAQADVHEAANHATDDHREERAPAVLVSRRVDQCKSGRRDEFDRQCGQQRPGAKRGEYRNLRR